MPECTEAERRYLDVLGSDQESESGALLAVYRERVDGELFEELVRAKMAFVQAHWRYEELWERVPTSPTLRGLLYDRVEDAAKRRLELTEAK